MLIQVGSADTLLMRRRVRYVAASGFRSPLAGIGQVRRQRMRRFPLPTRHRAMPLLFGRVPVTV
jgi:hypothetical protein